MREHRIKKIMLMTLSFVLFTIAIIFGYTNIVHANGIVKIELEEGSYQTQFDIGEEPTVTGANLVVTYTSGETNIIEVTEEMTVCRNTMAANVEKEYTLAVLDSEVVYGTDETMYAPYNPVLSVWYQSRSLEIPVAAYSDELVAIDDNGMVVAYQGTAANANVVIPPSINRNGVDIPIIAVKANLFMGKPIKSVDFPYTMKTLNMSSFQNCRALETVVFSDREKNESLEIMNKAFFGCLKVKTIALPMNLRFTAAPTANASFGGCIGLTEIKIDEGGNTLFSPSSGPFVGVPFEKGQEVTYENSYYWPLGKKVYTINFVTNCDQTLQTVKGPVNQVITLPMLAQPDKEFSGWFLDAAFASPVSDSYTINEIQALYAKWEEKVSALTTVIYHLDSEIQTESVDLSGEFQLYVPSKRGNEFKGWLDKSEEVVTNSNGNGSNYLIDGDTLDLYPDWDPLTFQITYDYDGAEVVSKPIEEVLYGGNYSLEIPQKIGNNFGGWYSIVGIQFTDSLGKSLKPWDKIENITLKAKWISKPYKIYYDTGEYGIIAGGVAYKNVYYGEKDIELSIPKWNDGTRLFKNWYSVSDDGHKIIYSPIIDEYKYTHDLHLIAEWQYIEFDIKYYDENNSLLNSDNNPSKYTYKQLENNSSISITPKYILGYDWTWHTSTSRDGVSITKIALQNSEGTADPSQFPGHIIKLYGKKTGQFFYVTYDYNGATSGIMDSQQQVQYGSSVRLAFPKFEGYYFMGWSYQGDVFTKNDDKNFCEAWSYAENTVIRAEKKGYNYDLTLTYIKDGKIVNTVQSVTYGKNFKINIKTELETGKSFVGWQNGGTLFTDAAGNSLNVWNKTNDLILTVKDEYSRYLITYDYQNAEFGNEKESTFLTYNSRFASDSDRNKEDIAKPGKNYYYFIAWYLEPYSNGQYFTQADVSHNKYSAREKELKECSLSGMERNARESVICLFCVDKL